MGNCTAILPTLRDCEPSKVSTNFEYWKEETTQANIKIACKQWFGKMLTNEQAKQVLMMLGDYPAPTKDEAIETVLTIFLNK